jgi:hypothetical protein
MVVVGCPVAPVAEIEVREGEPAVSYPMFGEIQTNIVR